MRTRRYPSDLSDRQWVLVAPEIPAARPGGRPRSTCMRAVFDALLYLLSTGCQWRQLPADFPPWPTVHGYFRLWRRSGVLARLHRVLHRLARVSAGRRPLPTVAIMDAQSTKTTGCGGARGFDGHKRIKGRKRHILVDILGLLLGVRVGPANEPDQEGGAALLAGLHLRWPTIRTIFADGGHEGRAFAEETRRREGVELRIVRRGRRYAFRVSGLTWIVERSFAWLGANRRLAKEYEFRLGTSETMVELAAIRTMLRRVARE
jgi:putative transposase